MRSLILILLLLIQPALAQSTRVNVTAPLNGSTVGSRFLLRGTATPGAAVDLTGNLRAQAIADADGEWTMDLDAQGYVPGDVLDLTLLARHPIHGPSPPFYVRYAVGPAVYPLAVTEPGSGSILPDGPFVLRGTAPPHSRVRVTGDLTGATYADEYGNWSLPLAMPQAPVSFTVTGAGEPVSLTYQPREITERIELSVNAPRRISNGIQLTGTANPGARIEVTGDMRGTALADPTGRWQLALPRPQLSEIELEVRAVSPSGARSSAIQIRYRR